MKNQQGAALVIVLALLAASLMIGISGMSSALINERLAGNYRAISQAQMNAERAASEAMAEFRNDKSAGRNSWVSARAIESIDESNDFFSLESVKGVDACTGADRCGYEFLISNGEYFIFAKGGVFASEEQVIVSESSFIKINFSFSGGRGGEDEAGERVTNSDIAVLLNKILNSGGLINVLNDYNFSGSQNQQSQDWINKISSDSSLFETASDACLFRDALLNGDIAEGLVKELSGNVKKDDLSNASDKIAVVAEDGFSLPNASEFTGVLMIFGEDFQITGGGNVEFDGAIIHVPVDCAIGSFYTPQIDIRGGNGNYNLSAIESIINQLDIDDENDEPDGNGGVVSSNNDLQVEGWQWSFD